MQGFAKIVVSYNGTQFTSAIFQQYLKANKIKCIRSAPATNGAAENMVETSKQDIIKAKYKNKSAEIYLILNRFLYL